MCPRGTYVRADSLALVLLAIWLAGSTCYFVLTSWRVPALGPRLRRVGLADADTQTLVATLSKRLASSASLRFTLHAGNIAPFVWALTSRPRIVVPAALWNEFDPEAADGTPRARAGSSAPSRSLGSRSGDIRSRTLLVASHCLVGWLRAREAEEQCCDAWAVWALPGKARAYAHVLMDTVDFLADAPTPLPVGASGIGQGHNLRRRLVMIMQGTTPRRLPAFALVALVGLGGLAIGIHPRLGEPACSSRREAGNQRRGETRKTGKDVQDSGQPAKQAVEQVRQAERKLRQEMQSQKMKMDRERKDLENLLEQVKKLEAVKVQMEARQQDIQKHLAETAALFWAMDAKRMKIESADGQKRTLLRISSKGPKRPSIQRKARKAWLN